MEKEKLIAYYQHKYDRCQKQVATLKAKYGNHPTKDFNFYGGQDLGFYQGKLLVLGDIIDDLNDLK